ncbi:MAG: hypothetical protein AAF990_28605 [Bacteroidota bacterium]
MIVENITKITISVSPENGGLAQQINIDVETKRKTENVRGVEVIQVLNEAISMILNEIV